jgi:D-alanyl-D-alanine carboxypeptidase
MSARRFAIHAAFALLGALLAGITVFAVAGAGRPARTASPDRGSPEASPSVTTHRVRLKSPGVVLAWSPGGLPGRARAVVAEIEGVRHTTIAEAGLDWIVSSRAPDGSLIDRPPRPFRIPFEVAAVEPQAYARFVPESERDIVASLRPGQILLARTSAELRDASVGARIKVSGRSLRVTGIVSDVATNGYEGLISQPAPRSWTRVDEFMLAEAGRHARARIDRRVRALLDPGRRLRTRVGGEQPFLRYGDAVHPQMIIKERFGEFSARPLPDGRIEVDPRWLADNIQTASIPLLGRITCHRALFPQLRAALHEIRGKGLGDLVEGFAGCYGPRFISRNPNGRLSHHAWGVAVDLNAGSNAFGAEPNMPARLVSIIESWGFTWGGRWLIPDGMHFEWTAFP